MNNNYEGMYRDPQYYINKQYIDVKDNIGFKTIYEVSKLFNKNYKGLQQTYFQTNDKKENMYV